MKFLWSPLSYLVVASACWLALSSVVVVVEATPTPSTTCASSGTNSLPHTSPNTSNGNAFGVPKTAKLSSMSPAAATAAASSILHHIRGGELHSPETLDEVNALVLNAAANGQLVVIDFTASWCGPCKMIAPLFKEMSEEIDDVVFLKVDVDENPETAAKYSVSAMPTFIFLKSGEVVDRLMGANVQRLQELIEEHM